MTDYEFDVLCNDGSFGGPHWVAGASAATREEALREAQHYVTQYSADGPCEIWEVIRRKVWPE